MEVLEATQIKNIFENQVNAFENNLSGISIVERKSKLNALALWIKTNSNKITDALYKDVGKPYNEALLSEVKTTLTEIYDNVSNINEWVEPTRVSAPLSLLGSKSYVLKQPKGVVLIIAPWNFPFQLTVIPLVSALAAGCRCILKPSEFAPNTAALLKEMVSTLFLADECCVIEGDVSTSQELLKLPFNHIFFTGSPQVGKHVMRAASEHLTSVTLELGGCNPLIVEPNANLNDACTKIAWGKLINAGQSCVSPNLIFVPESSKTEFINTLLSKIETLYGLGKNAESNGNMARIINNKHFLRVKNLIEDAILKGAIPETEVYYNVENSFISPTVLSNVTLEMNLVAEEIFGPIFAIKTYKTEQEIKSYLKKLPTPLAFYVFGNESSAKKWVNNSRAGTTAINETTIQVSHPELPFGGCNTSGIGKCHGYYGFREFVNERSVLVQPKNFYSAKFVYPPNSTFKNKLIKLLSLNFR